MDKRLKLLKLIADSDDKGIEAIWNSLYEKKKPLFSKEDFAESAATVFANMVIKDPCILIIQDVLAEFTREITKELFKEEK